MKILVKLFPYDSKASDGSLIPRSSIQEYLGSSEYKERVVTKKLSFLGVTHKDRQKSSDFSSIGPDDQVLINKNNVGFIYDIYLKDDGFAYAKVELFDPSNFSGTHKQDIDYVCGMIKSGVRPPVSAVVDAMWDANEVARKINGINGLDITMNPAFKGSEIVDIIKD